MMKRVDPTIELSAAALADYDAVMAYTNQIPDIVNRVRGLLTAMGLDKKVKIAFDEWNLRGWHHPNIHTTYQGLSKEEYLDPRDENDDNTKYTMADAVFSACFLNMCGRNSDIVGMANFAPIVNTRGCIYTYDKGIVLRSTYHVFDLYVNYLGDLALDGWLYGEEQTMVVKSKEGEVYTINTLDILPTYDSKNDMYSLAIVNKSADKNQQLMIEAMDTSLSEYRIVTVNGNSTEAYNDINHTGVSLLIPIISWGFSYHFLEYCGEVRKIIKANS